MNAQAPNPAQCLIALGANRGDTEQSVRDALRRLGEQPHTKVVRVSSLFRTTPVGGPEGQGQFINAAALLETQLSADEMLRWLLQLERDMGRERVARWGPREIDLDLLLFEQQQLVLEGLIVPHPRMAFRRFVLEPAAEAAPDMVHPTIGWSMRELLDHLNQSPFLLAIHGAEATAWMQRLQREFDALTVERGQAEDATSVLANAKQSGRLVVSDHLPDLQAPLRPRLIALLDQAPAEVEGPMLQLRGENDSSIATELTAAVEAMR